MKFGKYGLVIDTEGYSNQPFYNIGWSVIDLENLKIVETFSGVIPEKLSDNLTEKTKRIIDRNPANEYLAEMYYKNLMDILKGFNTKYTYVPSSRGMYQRLLNVIKKYSIRDVFAFNFPFDKGAFKRTFPEKCFENLDNILTFHDIQTAIFYTHCFNFNYIEWAIINGFVTEKGNIQTTAETIYKYVFNNLDFQEEHTALNDVLIETELLFKALERNREIETRHISAWCKLNELFENTEENRKKIVENFLFNTETD